MRTEQQIERLHSQTAMGTMSLSPLHLQYITNTLGEKISVILPIDEFEELLEDLHDLAMITERRDEPTIPHDEFIQELQCDGLLSD
jgi:hypothetical protein